MGVSGEGRQFELVRFSGTPEQISEAWRAERRKGVGGSDVAAIMGMSPYKSPYEVWAEKTGVVEPADLSGVERVMWGNVLEPVVGDHYRELHPEREVRRVNAMCRSIARPWAQASLDYEVRDPDLGWGVLEIKTVGYRSAPMWDDGVPIFYLTQVVHYLSVTGRPFADVAALIGGQEYREIRIMRDPADVEAVDAAVDAFWRDAVVGGVEPSPVAGDSPALLRAHPEGDAYLVMDQSECPEFDRWAAAKRAADIARERLDAAAAALKARIGDAEGIDLGTGRVTWLRGTAQSFDRKRFDAEHPGLYKSYCTPKPRDMGLRFKERK